MTPKAYFDDIWFRCAETRSLFSYLNANLTSAMSPDELLRAEWVSRVSALDLYVHELVAQNMGKIFEGSRPSCPGFSRFRCSVDTTLRIRDSTTPQEASAAFDLEVRDQLSRITFQYPDDIADGIRFISPCELWNEIAIQKGATEATKSKNAKVLKKELSLIVERRNKIVHEGDLQPTIPRQPWPIDAKDVSQVETYIEELVCVIDDLV